MSRMFWSIPKAVDMLAEAYLVDLGGKGLMADPDPVTLEALARALQAHPEVLEQVWKAWEDQLIGAEWSEGRRDQAQDWLNAVLIGGIVPG